MRGGSPVQVRSEMSCLSASNCSSRSGGTDAPLDWPDTDESDGYDEAYDVYRERDWDV